MYFDIIMSENAVAQLGTGIVFCLSLHFCQEVLSFGR